MENFITISRKEYESLKRENADLRAEIAELRILVGQLKDTIALLRGGKNSRTSSTAPSHDICRSNSKSLRVSSDKKSGGQTGHTGHTLDMVDTPDEIIEHLPAVCQCCGNGLANTASVSFTRRQVVDIPPILPVYTEHRSQLKICPFCQTVNHGVFPDFVTAPIQYGCGIEAMAGYLSVYQSLPYARITRLFRDFFKLSISEGAVDRFIDNLSNKANFAYETIRERIQSSTVVGADETGCRVNGKKHWFHVWQTADLTFIAAFASRGHQIINNLFDSDFGSSYYVSDCWASQLKVKAKMHQLCLAHLLRDLTNFVDNLGSQWSAKMKALFKCAIELKNRMTVDDYLNPPQEVEKLNGQLDELLKTDYSKFHKKEQAFVKRMIKNRHSIFTFLTHPSVPPDNNASERAIRNVKVKMKVSGQFRNSDGKGADRYAKIRSVIDTTIKNGQDVYDALVCMANCKKIEVPE